MDNDDKLNELESQMVELVREVKVLREKNTELELHIASIEKGREVNSEDKESVFERSQRPLNNDEKMESDEVGVWLKIENNVCEFEKQKCKELELQLASFREKEEFLKVANTIHDSQITSPTGHTMVLVNEVTHNEGIFCVKTPHRSVNFNHDIQFQIINLDGVPHSRASRKELFSRDNVLTPFASTEIQGGEDANDFNEEISFVATPKRKRSLNVVTSDTESDDDDNISIAQVLKKNHQLWVPHNAVSECDMNADFSSRRRRRLVKVGEYKTYELENDDDGDDDDNSRRSFIVSSSDVSESEEEDVSESGEVASDVPQDFSKSSADFDGILDKIRRTKDHGSEWEMEGDMLSAFGKDNLLCMKAVCALY